MTIRQTDIKDVLVVEPKVYRDDRGFFFESFNQRAFCQAIRRTVSFVQDNHSLSAKHVLRGLHYQIQQPQGKLVRVIAGAVFDVAVDLRRTSSTFGQWVGEVLTAENQKQIWVPEGFAHGFLALSDHTEVLYKTTDYWSPQDERCIIWNDATIGIMWPIDGLPVISSKDGHGLTLQAAEVFA
jgi:dTDP-4-dehydrorhamnose 3,5-epimerase